MKKSVILKTVNKFLLLVIFSSLQLLTLAQDSTATSHTTKTTTTTSTSFEMQPWMWITGGVVLLLLIIALARGGSRTEKVSTTVIKDRT